MQVYLPKIKEHADDGDFYRSFGPYRALELFVLLTAGWCELHSISLCTLHDQDNHLSSQTHVGCPLDSCIVCLVLAVLCSLQEQGLGSASTHLHSCLPLMILLLSSQP